MSRGTGNIPGMTGLSSLSMVCSSSEARLGNLDILFEATLLIPYWCRLQHSVSASNSLRRRCPAPTLSTNPTVESTSKSNDMGASD